MGIDELRGRELDALVAERLFGLEVEEHTNTKTGEQEPLCRQPGKQWVPVAFYSSTLSASISVELELRTRGWKRTLPLVGAPGNVRVALVHTDGRTVEAFGPMNLAICWAALNAVAK
jgi:hypothetical protein